MRGRFKQYFISEVLWIFANIFTASQSRFCLEGHSSDAVRPKEEEKVEEGGYYWDPVYYFGLGFLLTVWSWGRSAQRADTGWPQLDTEATWLQRSREEGEPKRKSEKARNVAELFLALPLSFIFRPLLPHRCLLSSWSVLFSFQLHPEQTSTSTSSISLCTDPPHPLAALSSDRQTELPSWTFPFCWPAATKVLSHVKPNLQPPKT